MGLDQTSAVPGRNSLLDAVNVLLENIGEAPVNTLDNQQIAEARVAERTLLEFHQDGQARGWSWNTEYEAWWPRNVDSEIVLPENVATFAPCDLRYAGRYVLRGQRVYDRQLRTYVMEPGMTGIAANVVLYLPWEETPEAFNRWTTIRAAKAFSNRMVGSDSLFRYTAQDEQDALAALHEVELQIEQPNMVSGGRPASPFPTFQPRDGVLWRGGAGGRLIG